MANGRPKVRDADVLGQHFDPSQAGAVSPLPSAARFAPEPEDQPRVLELLAVVLASASGLLTALALLGAAAPSFNVEAHGLALGGLGAGLGSFFASLRIGTLRHLRASTTGGTAYDRLRGARALRVGTLVVQLLSLAAWAVIALRILTMTGAGPDLETAVVDRGLLVVVAALGAAMALTHLQSLRTPTQRDRSVPTWTIMGLGAGAAAFLCVVGAFALAGTQPAVGAVDWEADDSGFLALAGLASLAAALRRSRGLPSTATVLVESQLPDGEGLAVNRTKAVLIPTILAFALLLVVFLLVLLFGIGIGDLLTTVGGNPLILGALVFLVFALLGSLGLAMLMSRSAERDVPLFKEVMDRKLRVERWILASSGVVATVLMVLAVLSFVGPLDRSWSLHFVCFSLLVALGPFGFHSAREANRVRRLEERFPDFLRDIASSHKGGLTLHQSVTIAARGEYGPLTPEVRKMADQLSWNVSFHEALGRFSDRVETPLVQRAVNLIVQADKSGGSTTDVLLAAARDAREIKNLENERRQTMGLYTVVVYITFFVFLAVAATLYGQFAPAIVASSQAVQDSSLSSQQFGGGSLDLADYQLFYFTAAIVQAVGDGLVGGLLGSGRARLGLRHAFLMVAATYLLFILLL